MADSILVKQFDSSLPLPMYKTPGAAAFDLATREELTIAPRSIGYAPLNVALKLPEGHFILMFARSSLHKKGLMPANAVGVMDADYCGDEDEYRAALFNFSDQPVTIEKGERIMQAVVLPYTQHAFEAVDHLGTSRGGFGSTGTH